MNQGNLTEGGRLSTVDLRALTSLDHLLFVLKILSTLLQTSYLNEEVNCIEQEFPSVRIPRMNMANQRHGTRYDDT